MRNLRRLAPVLGVVAAFLVPGAALAGWSPVTTLNPAPTDMIRHGLAVAPNGTATAAWEVGSRIDFRRLRADGTRTRVRPLSTDVSSFADIGVSARGVATVVWSSGDGRARARRIAANGRLGPVLTLSELPWAASQVEVAVAPGGAAVASWHRVAGDGVNFIVEARRINADGSLGPLLTIATEPTNQPDPAPAIDRNGRATVAWVGTTSGANRIVRMRRVSAGSVLGTTQNLSIVGANQFFVDVAAGSDGSAFAVWRRSNGTHAIVQGRRIAANDTLGGILDLSEAGQNASGQPRVALLTNGTALAAWSRSDGTNTIAQSRRISPAGVMGPVQNRSAPGRNADDVAAVAGPRGHSAVAWRRFDGEVDMIQVARISPAGVPRAVASVSPRSGHSGSPVLGFSAIGTITVGWDHFLDDRDVFQARIHRPKPPTTRLRGATIDAARRRASFRFTGAGGAGKLAFQCRLTGAAATAGQRRWAGCRSGKAYAGLPFGSYVFHVRARDQAGQVDRTPARRSFGF